MLERKILFYLFIFFFFFFSQVIELFHLSNNIYLYILYTLAVSPSLEQRKQWEVLLRSSSNDEGPSRVWMALLEQHSPPSHVADNTKEQRKQWAFTPFFWQ